MSANSTPGGRSQNSPSTPSTPKLPFDPPRRRSSLAFSKILDSPSVDGCSRESLPAKSTHEHQTPYLCPGVGEEPSVETPVRCSGASPGHVAQIQRIFQTARANLHLDMHFAASPVGSIDSRLPQQDRELSISDSKGYKSEVSSRSWRYSTVPNLFSVTNSDVREPLPNASPVLPILTSQDFNHDGVAAVEPVSSGFASPLNVEDSKDGEGDEALPPLPLSSSLGSDPGDGEYFHQYSVIQSDEEDICDLTHPMTGLRVKSDQGFDDECLSDEMDDSPIVDHLRWKSGHETNASANLSTSLDTIFLSKSARAAAESAKAKRRILNESLDKIGNNENIDSNNYRPDPAAHQRNKLSCPDPGLHQYFAASPCPDPFAHAQMNISRANTPHLGALRAQQRAWGNEYHITGGVATHHGAPLVQPIRRTTAAGSPMPFTRQTRYTTVEPDYNQVYRAPFTSPPIPQLPYLRSGCKQVTAPQHGHNPSEHFRPGWFNVGQSFSENSRPSTNLYSFSTAAAKATGVAAAPDLRIRDSYRTDTLTPLARPQGRFKKTGLAATLQRVESRRPRGRGLPLRTSARRAAFGQGQTYELPDTHGIQFHSSPPRPSAHYNFDRCTRKRSANQLSVLDSEATRGNTVNPERSSARSQQSTEVMKLDESTRAAVRMSIFGDRTPECLQGEREGIKELSPNVNIWRKGMAGGPHYRKKRRPSYWDGDLEEVKMSPAGRGGIESSPTISKRSMVAEFENVSTQSESVVMDKNKQLVEKAGGTVVLNVDGQMDEAAMADAMEVQL